MNASSGRTVAEVLEQEKIPKRNRKIRKRLKWLTFFLFLIGFLTLIFGESYSIIGYYLLAVGFIVGIVTLWFSCNGIFYLPQ
jgi:hypothetical protein